MAPLRFGIIGCGVIAPMHAEAIRDLPDAELVAVADPVPERAQNLADRYSVCAYDDLAEMLARDDLDVVSVCTPSGLHGEAACAAMRTGRHVMVEKPIEIRLQAIDEMLRVQQEQGVKLAVISQHRFDPASQAVHHLVEEGAFGRLVLGSASIPWWRSQAYYDSGDWRGTRALDGGGVLMNQGIHSIDLLQWLMGPVRSVFAYADTRAHQIETEDVAVAVLRFASGALGTLSVTTAAYPGGPARIEVFGDRGSAVVEEDQLRYLHLVDRAEEAPPYGFSDWHANQAIDLPVEQPAPTVTSHELQIADLTRAIRDDGTPLVDGRVARHPVQIILAVYESANRGQEVMLS